MEGGWVSFFGHVYLSKDSEHALNPLSNVYIDIQLPIWKAACKALMFFSSPIFLLDFSLK